MNVDERTRARLVAALRRHARHEMRWGGDVVRQIDPTAVEHLRVWSAQLDTVAEERVVRRVVRPVSDQAQESPAQRAGVPDVWAIEAEIPLELENGTHEVDIAGTEHIKTCMLCHGETKVRCPECGGEGRNGYRRTCLTCRGTGLAPCDGCERQGRVVELHVLEVLRRHEVQRHADRDTPVPTEALAQATRDELLHLDLPRLDTTVFDASTAAYRGRGPSADPEFDRAVREMIASVRVDEPARIVRQRLIVRHLPVIEVSYDWRGDPGTFWVVGTEEHVWGDQMPLQGAYVSRAVSAARKRFGSMIGDGLFSRLGRKK